MKFLISLLVILGLYFKVHAQEVSVIPKTQEYVIEDSSEHNRFNKKISIVVQLLGAESYTLGNTTGIKVSYFLSRNSQIGLSVDSVKKDRYEGSFLFRQGYASTGVELSFKQFFGNSFYLTSGLRHQNITVSDSNRSIFYEEDYYAWEAKGNRSSALLAIGNQWQWENFTMGVDWIGLGLPLASSSKEKSLAKGADLSASSNYRKEIEQIKKENFKDSYALALRFYLGASF